ncbi:MAG TPA: flagellar FlbD family protein [Blastococcus sp.]|nr:flagellar FlbD family protein [Blastococcus sp.]
MIAVTCRNGEHFSVDPGAIERVETDPDTVVHLVDGRKYVVAVGFDELLCLLHEYAASTVVARQRLAGGVAQIVERRRPAMRIERRARSRDTDSGRPVPGDVPPDPDAD